MIHFENSQWLVDHGTASSGREPATEFYRTRLKRVLDVMVVLASAPFVLPLVAFLALISIGHGTSPFYRQPRLGRGSRVFNLLKLRTMVADADAVLESYLANNPQARQEWDLTQKLKHDPRITRFGGILRRTSLDELPQLWNVLRGDMSLVGPRPMMVAQKALYPGTAYFDLRPGITGSWQVSVRNDSPFAQRAVFDTEYHAHISFKTDLSILARTVGVMLRGTGR